MGAAATQLGLVTTYTLIKLISFSVIVQFDQLPLAETITAGLCYVQAGSDKANANIALEKDKNKLVKMVQALGVGQQVGGTGAVYPPSHLSLVL